MISLEALYLFCRFSHFIVVMLMFGLSLFTVMLMSGHFSTLMRERLKSGILISTVLALVTSIIWFVVQAGLMGDGWHDVYVPEIWLAVLSTSFGQIWQWQLLVAIFAVGALFLSNTKIRNNVLLSCSVILLSSHAFIGHAAMYEGKIGLLLQANQVIHLLSAGYWFGGLWPFLVCLQFLRIQKGSETKPYCAGQYAEKKKGAGKGNNSKNIATDQYSEANLYAESIVVMRKFSLYGHLAVFLVIVTGIVSSVILIPGWPVFSRSLSEYQSMLWLKIVLVVGMVLLALINRYILVPRLKQQRCYQLLIINSWLEIILGTTALLCVAIFATQPPV
ncbi:copper resistance D family protein [Xenorhabdus nematophila]|uniref:CopD family protein n=1 Tax=Xenorhabdus nematophila TaxID=628 RepID=UPI0005427E8B|nr:CopD family protein [Xenorhabdus nematophila]CEF30548.1 putative resistance protein [Xenorhabdus nematophila str. Websteri]AYA40474.1 copper resistance protein CopD [Xenorhabdus nematophila]KHD27806.1 copper resistance protein CopD [Xenorhabdus nematophila]MBA0019210.1 copper resistance D family protein [Xenorhabdus nematophila]MCB4425555.1 copper resistance protein CopD [Xenorhabdus nematophila]